MTESSDAPISISTARPRFEVRLWNVRGSHAAPGQGAVRYGGHTTCVEVRCDDRVLVIDMGSGACRLGSALLAERPTGPLEIDILFSHLHSDHIIGLPFFEPLYLERTRLRIRGDDDKNVGLRAGLQRLMSFPLFPVDLDEVPADLSVTHLGAGDTARLGDVTLRTCALNHPGGALGFRIEHRGKAFVHLSDREHVGEDTDPALIALCEGADWICYDGMFVEGIDFERHRGWGHSTWQAAVRLVEALERPARLIVTHHAPSHDDAFLDRQGEALGAALPGALMAIEGMEICLLSEQVRLPHPAGA